VSYSTNWIASEYAVTRPQSAASGNGVSNFAQADLSGVIRAARQRLNGGKGFINSYRRRMWGNPTISHLSGSILLTNNPDGD
jgi:hypothetical protein